MNKKGVLQIGWIIALIIGGILLFGGGEKKEAAVGQFYWSLNFNQCRVYTSCTATSCASELAPQYTTQASCEGANIIGGAAICGNNKIEGSEVCDGTDLAGKTCTNFGYSGGTLGCTACQSWDTTKCTTTSTICTDSDGKDNFKTAGYVIDLNKYKWNDECSSIPGEENKAIDGFCQNNGNIGNTKLDCKSYGANWICQNGACMAGIKCVEDLKGICGWLLPASGYVAYSSSLDCSGGQSCWIKEPSVCIPTETKETKCSDGSDNDCDKLTDSADTDCAISPDCYNGLEIKTGTGKYVCTYQNNKCIYTCPDGSTINSLNCIDGKSISTDEKCPTEGTPPPGTKTCADLSGTWSIEECKSGQVDITSSAEDKASHTTETCCRPEIEDDCMAFIQEFKSGKCKTSGFIFIIGAFMALMMFMKMMQQKD